MIFLPLFIPSLALAAVAVLATAYKPIGNG
jgi:hypothetical protein